MKQKPINLCLWMFLKTIPAALLLLYYWMCTLEGYNPVLRYLHGITLVLAIGLAWTQISYAKRRQLFDEFARENLKLTDSLCLKLACLLMAAATLACVFADFSGIVAGYCVVWGLFALTVVRAILFTVIDKRGLDLAC